MANATIKQKIGTFVNPEGDEQVDNMLLKPTNSTNPRTGDPKRSNSLNFYVTTSSKGRSGGIMLSAEQAPEFCNLKKPAKDAIKKLQAAVKAGAWYHFGEVKQGPKEDAPEGASGSGSAVSEEVMAELKKQIMDEIMASMGK